MSKVTRAIERLERTLSVGYRLDTCQARLAMREALDALREEAIPEMQRAHDFANEVSHLRMFRDEMIPVLHAALPVCDHGLNVSPRTIEELLEIAESGRDDLRSAQRVG